MYIYIIHVYVLRIRDKFDKFVSGPCTSCVGFLREQRDSRNNCSENLLRNISFLIQMQIFSGIENQFFVLKRNCYEA